MADSISTYSVPAREAAQDVCQHLETRICALGDERFGIYRRLGNERVFVLHRDRMVARKRAIDVEEEWLWDELRRARARAARAK